MQNLYLNKIMLSSHDNQGIYMDDLENLLNLDGEIFAHSFKSTKKYGAKKESYDHIHKQMDIVAYEFETASQLIEDFWESAEYYMENYR